MTSFSDSISFSFQACHKVTVPDGPAGSGSGVGSGAFVGSSFLSTGTGVSVGSGVARPQLATSKLVTTIRANKAQTIFFIFISFFSPFKLLGCY